MQAARGASLSPSENATPTQPRRRPLQLVFASIAVLALAADQLTKQLAVERLSGKADVEVVGSFLTLHLTRNPGAAFSTGTAFTEAFTALAVVASVAVLWFARRLGSTAWAIGLGFLLAGILGNLADRLFREPAPFQGHVIDFLRLPHWPVFNFADVFINIAAGVIILQSIRGVRIDGARHEEEPAG